MKRSTDYVGRSTRTENAEDDTRADPQRSRETDGRSRSDKNRSRRREDRPTSSQGRSQSRSNLSKSRADDDKYKYKSEQVRSKSTRDDQRATREIPKRYREKRLETRDRGGKVVQKVALPVANENKFDTILHFFPRLERCCCWSLRSGCLFIGWTQVIGSLIVGCTQTLIAMVCFELINLGDFFNNFPDKINPAKTVSDFADDYCAGLSIGYASGELIGFGTGIMLLVAVSKDHIHLLRLWMYVAILMLLPTITFYGIAIYAISEYRNDVPVIAVPSTIELVSFVILGYCTCVIKSYYYERVDYFLGISQQEPILVQERGETDSQV